VEQTQQIQNLFTQRLPETFHNSVRAAGGSVQLVTGAHGAFFTGGGFPWIFSAFTKTGMIWPVPSPNSRWPRTVHMSEFHFRFYHLLPNPNQEDEENVPLNSELISPEWLEILIQVFLSFENTSSSTTFVLISWASAVSLSSFLQRRSSSSKPGSNTKDGYALWITDLLLPVQWLDNA